MLLGDELHDQGAGHARGEQGSATDHGADRREQLRGRGVLEQEAGGPGVQRLEHVLVALEGGQHDHPHLRELGAGDDPPRRLDPVDAGHADVPQHHIRHGADGLGDGGQTVGRLPGEGEAVLGLQQGEQTALHQVLVVGRQLRDPWLALPVGLLVQQLWGTLGGAEAVGREHHDAAVKTLDVQHVPVEHVLGGEELVPSCCSTGPQQCGPEGELLIDHGGVIRSVVHQSPSCRSLRGPADVKGARSRGQPQVSHTPVYGSA